MLKLACSPCCAFLYWHQTLLAAIEDVVLNASAATVKLNTYADSGACRSS
jgi:hypothetical protein